MPLKPKDNLTYKQRQALKKLTIDDAIIINTLDQQAIHHNTTRISTTSQRTPEFEQNEETNKIQRQRRTTTKHNPCPIPPA